MVCNDIERGIQMRHASKGRTRGTRSRRAKTGIRPIEGLESRAMLTGISFVPATLTVLIEGSGGPDAAEVRLNPRSSLTTFDDRLEVSLAHDGLVEVASYAAYQLRQTPQGNFQLAPVQVQFEGLGGNDSFAD